MELLIEEPETLPHLMHDFPFSGEHQILRQGLDLLVCLAVFFQILNVEAHLSSDTVDFDVFEVIVCNQLLLFLVDGVERFEEALSSVVPHSDDFDGAFEFFPQVFDGSVEIIEDSVFVAFQRPSWVDARLPRLSMVA